MSDDLGTPYLRFERRGSVGWCIVDRPEAKNALTAAMYFGLRYAVDVVANAPELRALVITGTGDVFIPGGDMSGAVAQTDDTRQLGALIGTDMLPFHRLRVSPVPVVAAVNGLCQGGGLIVATLADLAVVSDRATFRAPEALRGVVDGNLASILPAHVGLANARDLLLTGRRIDAHEAQRMGLVARVVPHEELEVETTRAVGELLAAAPNTWRETKRILNANYAPVDQMTFDASFRSDEAMEGFRAFKEKRPPAWVPPEFRQGGRL